MDISNKWCTRERPSNFTFRKTGSCHCGPEAKSRWQPFHRDGTFSARQLPESKSSVRNSQYRSKEQNQMIPWHCLNPECRCSSGLQISKGIWRSRHSTGRGCAMCLHEFFWLRPEVTFEARLPAAAVCTVIPHSGSSWATWAGFWVNLNKGTGPTTANATCHQFTGPG